MTTLGFFFDIPFLLITLFLIIKFRFKIVDLFLKISIPNFLLYLLSSLPFIIIEENINCGAFNCNYTLIPFTIPFLLFYMLIIGVFYRKFKPKNYIKFIIIFSIIGVLFEMFLGVSNVEFKALPFFWIIFISIWVGISYAYFMIVPLLILKFKKV